MFKKLLVALVITGAFTYCGSDNNDKQAETETTDSSQVTDTKVNSHSQEEEEVNVEDLIPYEAAVLDSGQFCYINKVYIQNGKTFLEADYIQFFMGDEAVEAARVRGDAMADVTSDGDTSW